MLQNKSAIRSQLLQKRNSISIQDRIEWSKKITTSIIEDYWLPKYSIFHCYCSYGSEVETTTLIQKVLSLNIQVAVPIVKNSKGELTHSLITTSTNFEDGKFGIPQPTLITEITNEQLNKPEVVIIVPLVGFDRNCHRIGYGGGYYDRFLQQVPKSKKIGIAFSIQETNLIPIESTDIPLDEITTENQVFKRKDIF